MKRKIELVCWILFTLCSGICFFINFMSKPPVDEAKLKTAISATGYEVKGISSQPYEKKKGLFSFFHK